MNEIQERYIGAVCSYFLGNKRKKVYKNLKENIEKTQYDDLKQTLIQYGHPFSVALSYGYKPLFYHLFNKKVVYDVERNSFIISGIYLVVSTLYYLQQFNCLPFFSNHKIFEDINSSSLISWILIHPFYILGSIFLIAIICLFIMDHKHAVSQKRTLKWDIDELNKLPHSSHYPNHTFNSYLIVLFILYFIIYSLIFSSSMIIEIQHSTYQMIHLMTYFFQPFILMILFDYFIDMTKKTYTKRYLTATISINIFIVVALSIFIINTSFLKEYLLPFSLNIKFDFVNFLIIGALLFIFGISLYKLICGIRSYRSLFIN